jgi:hypothetical protein
VNDTIDCPLSVVAETPVGAPGVAVLHEAVDEALIVFVTVLAPEYERDIDDVALLQMLDVTSD